MTWEVWPKPMLLMILIFEGGPCPFSSCHTRSQEGRIHGQVEGEAAWPQEVHRCHRFWRGDRHYQPHHPSEEGFGDQAQGEAPRPPWQQHWCVKRIWCSATSFSWSFWLTEEFSLTLLSDVFVRWVGLMKGGCSCTSTVCEGIDFGEREYEAL